MSKVEREGVGMKRGKHTWPGLILLYLSACLVADIRRFFDTCIVTTFGIHRHRPYRAPALAPRMRESEKARRDTGGSGPSRVHLPPSAYSWCLPRPATSLRPLPSTSTVNINTFIKHLTIQSIPRSCKMDDSASKTMAILIDPKRKSSLLTNTSFLIGHCL